MSNYTLQFSPATYSAAAGALMIAAILVAQAKADAMDSTEAVMQSSTMAVGKYRELGITPTIGVNVGESVAFDANRYLGEASQYFAKHLSDEMQPLGAGFSEVLEDNFWDLVLG